MSANRKAALITAGVVGAFGLWCGILALLATYVNDAAALIWAFWWVPVLAIGTIFSMIKMEIEYDEHVKEYERNKAEADAMIGLSDVRRVR